MEEFLRALLGSRYEKLFERLLRDETMSQTARIVQIELFYYETMWKCKNQLKDAAMRTICTQLFGTEIDWQNIMWLYRAKRFYHQKGEEILCDLIPVSYRLGMEEKRALAESETMEAFAQILENTAYFKGKDALAAIGDEVTFPQIMEKIYGRLCKKYPMSLAPVFKYLYDKEQEIDKLTTILEGVRYQIQAQKCRTCFVWVRSNARPMREGYRVSSHGGGLRWLKKWNFYTSRVQRMTSTGDGRIFK